MTKAKPEKITVAPLGVNGLDLYRILTDAQMFAGRDNSLPMLYGVQLEADGKRLHARATDRFTLGISTTVYEGPAFKVFLPMPEVDLLRAFTRPGRGWRKTRIATLHCTPQATILRVSIDGATVSVPAGRVEFPKFRQLFPSTGTEVEAFTGGMGFNPAYLARFGRVGGRHSGARYYQQGRNKPMVVTVGDDFVGLIMPVRTPDDQASRLSLPDWF